MAKKPKSPASGSDRNMAERAKVGAQKQNNMRAIRDSGRVINRTDRISGMDKSGGTFETFVGKQYFGENPKNNKKPTVKKK